MRKLILAAMVSVSALAAAPAFADSGYSYQGQQSRSWDRDRDGRNDRLEDRAYDQRFDRDRDGRNDRLEDRAFDQRFGGGYGRGHGDAYGRGHGGAFDAPYSFSQYSQWYPGWRHAWYDQRAILPPHRLIRRVERQGYFGVRTMGFSRRGMIRAIAFDQWRQPVDLRIDPFTGAVLRVRPA
jgi:hypothetical protein